MEVPVLNRITEFRGDLGSFPNPDFLSRIFTSFSLSLHFWKWGAVILALFATFSGLINRVKILIIVIRRRSPTSPIPAPLSPSLHGGESGSLISENLRSSPSLESKSEDENEGDQDDESDFRVKGSGDYDGLRRSGLRRRHGGGGGDGDLFSWSDFGLDRSVVRQWGDVKLKCEYEEQSGSVISLYDENGEAEICSLFSGGARLQVVALSTARTVVAAGEGGLGNVALKLWDTRGGSRTPVVAAEWNLPPGRIVDMYSDVEKVYIRDNGAAGIMVGDVRKFGSASKKSPVSGVEGWWEWGHRRQS